MSKMQRCLIVLAIAFLLPVSGFAVLTASTVKTIQGHQPLFKVSSPLAKHTPFEVNGTTYKEFDNSYNLSIIFSSALTLNDFVIGKVNTNAFSITDDYDSFDGDHPHPTFPLIYAGGGSSTYVWKDGSTTIPSSAYNNPLSSYASPLTLEIQNPALTLQSEYGDPNQSLPEVFTQKYLINHQKGIFALRPLGLDVNSACQWMDYVNGTWQCLAIGSGGIAPFGGGYSAEYIPNVGFSPTGNGTSVFPTIAFKGAQFKVVMTGNQLDYTFSVTPPVAGVSIDTNGIVTFSSKPATSSVTINAIKSTPPVINDSYTFTIQTWVEPKSPLTAVDYFSAITLCGGENNILTRAELTNSPMSIGLIDLDWAYQRNYGTRGIGSLYSEWGHLTNYGASDWVSSPYWTKDRRSNWAPTAIHFFVHANDGGYVGYKFDDDNDTVGGGLGMRVACKN